MPPPDLLRRQGQQKKIYGENARRDPDVFIRCIVVAVSHVDGGPQSHQIHRKNNTSPELQNIVICKAQQEAENHGNPRPGLGPPRHHPSHPEDQVVPKGRKQQLGVVQRGEGVIFIQILHAQICRPRPQQKEKPGGGPGIMQHPPQP
ncbi:hypothetical protein SDC9_105843 [bioreactor metagenome]|uniref:Uncharacterized protein n=1 Tax=bioreactor metagenome TaxID=1076179 RepID=A0A645B1Q7_9ZZZZ